MSTFKEEYNKMQTLEKELQKANLDFLPQPSYGYGFYIPAEKLFTAQKVRDALINIGWIVKVSGQVGGEFSPTDSKIVVSFYYILTNPKFNFNIKIEDDFGEEFGKNIVKISIDN